VLRWANLHLVGEVRAARVDTSDPVDIWKRCPGSKSHDPSSETAIGMYRHPEENSRYDIRRQREPRRHQKVQAVPL
jgi:hypothetical protein